MKYVRYRGIKVTNFEITIMEPHIQMEERLWDYIDGLSSPAEKSAVETLIAQNIEWLRKYKELLNIHQTMQEAELGRISRHSQWP